MKNLEKIKSIRNVVKEIKLRLEEWGKVIGNHSCDKHGMGFNKDSRFSTLKLSLSIDSWTGYYGNSGCSTYLHINDKEEFKKCFIKVLNKNFKNIMLETCEELDLESKKYTDEAEKEIYENLKIIKQIKEI